MLKDTWKKFDEIELTHSSVHHLLAMHELLAKNGYVRGVDIAKYLGISRSSVSITIHKLVKKGYIREDENKFYHFTDKGRELINNVLSKRRIIRLFFEKVLNLSEKMAEEEACKVEHLLEEETGQRLMNFVGFFLSNQGEANEFRKAFDRFIFDCAAVESCEFCELDCCFAGKQNEQH
ncbi:MAG: metal-dependent transcriptional regulator [Caldisericaceae bacterium]|nr:metal-dependent transcriptional regulator [Caldisericaceae bacterium]